jgi:hypothetical protein
MSLKRPSSTSCSHGKVAVTRTIVGCLGTRFTTRSLEPEPGAQSHRRNAQSKALSRWGCARKVWVIPVTVAEGTLPSYSDLYGCQSRPTMPSRNRSFCPADLPGGLFGPCFYRPVSWGLYWRVSRHPKRQRALPTNGLWSDLVESQVDADLLSRMVRIAARSEAEREGQASTRRAKSG